MSQYIQVIYTAAIVFPFLAILITFPFLLINYHRYGAISKWNILMTYSFVFYMLCAYFLIILPLPSREYVAQLTTPRYNLVPLTFVMEFIKHNPLVISNSHTWIAAIKDASFIQPVFNVILTIPFGFYLRYFFQKSFLKTTLFSFLLSLFFELTQLSGLYGIYARSYRLFDVDDLFLNTLGGVIGFLLTGLVIRFLPTQQAIRDSLSKKSQNVSIFRRGIAFIVDLALFNILSSVLFIFDNPTKQIIAFIIVIMFPELLMSQTIGMKIVKIKITNIDFQKASPWQLIVRNVVAYGLMGGIILINSRLLTATGYVAESQLHLVYQLAIGTLGLSMLVVLDFLLETFSAKHRLFFEKLSRTETIGQTNN